jgi:hypothetical protein
LLKNEPEGWAWLQRFLEAVLVEALRWPSLGHESLALGLIAGLGEAPVSGSLRATHSDVRHGWTLAEATGRLKRTRVR